MTGREIVLDTETTGLNPDKGARIVEIGCIELINYCPTGKRFHSYFNPECVMPEGAYAVHRLSTEFLADKPLFAHRVEELLAFLQEATLIIHNADFDMKMLNAELRFCGYSPLSMESVVDTLLLARRKFPGSPASLDALCRQFGIDRSHREVHGALIDAELLTEVYVELIGGRAPKFDLPGLNLAAQSEEISSIIIDGSSRVYHPPRPHYATETEKMAHRNFIANLKNPLWK